MIRARRAEHPRLFLRNQDAYMFVMETENSPTRVLCIDKRVEGSEHPVYTWPTTGEVWPGGTTDAVAEYEPFVLTLERDVLAALADAVITDQTGVPAADVRLLRQDYAHEKDRRDKLEDVMVEVVQAWTRR